MQRAQIPFVVNQSMAASFQSIPILLDQMFGYAVTASYTTSGTLGGTLALQASADHRQDPEGNVLVVGNFDTITDSPIVIANAGSYTWNVRDTNYFWFRLIYTPAVGDTGTLNATANIKGI